MAQTPQAVKAGDDAMQTPPVGDSGDQAPDEPNATPAPKPKKKRKVYDYNVFMSRKGLPTLQKAVHEAAFVPSRSSAMKNLNQLMSIYKNWASTVFPNLRHGEFFKKTASFAPKFRAHLKELREQEFIRAHRSKMAVEDLQAERAQRQQSEFSGPSKRSSSTGSVEDNVDMPSKKVHAREEDHLVEPKKQQPATSQTDDLDDFDDLDLGDFDAEDLSPQGVAKPASEDDYRQDQDAVQEEDFADDMEALYEMEEEETQRVSKPPGPKVPLPQHVGSAGSSKPSRLQVPSEASSGDNLRAQTLKESTIEQGHIGDDTSSLTNQTVEASTRDSREAKQRERKDPPPHHIG